MISGHVQKSYSFFIVFFIDWYNGKRNSSHKKVSKNCTDFIESSEYFNLLKKIVKKWIYCKCRPGSNSQFFLEIFEKMA
jgi:hypothetical protein